MKARKLTGYFVLGAALAGTALACGASDRDDEGMFGPGDGTGGPDGGTGDGSDGSGGDDGDDGGGDGGKFDVGDGTGDPGCADPDGECGCSGVDLLFVIDNSGSMGDYQSALALAFPQFAATLVEALPAGTNVHVGVTSTEMQQSMMGSTSISNNVCMFTGDGGQPHTAFYVTPDQTDTGRNGAQGRLYKPGGGGDPYFDFNTDGGASELAALESWFSQAAQIGEGGSNIEMLTAPTGWVGDPANSATNEGFIRDEGAVMVVFFMQDEPDQTPEMIDGMPGGTAMLSRLAAVKSGCGGVDCIVAGGFLASHACGGRPIDEFLAGIPTTPNIAMLPPNPEGNPQGAADQMNEYLSTTLAQVIAQKCDEIPPAG